MPKVKVRIERIEVADPDNEEYRFVAIDSDGDIYICDGSSDTSTQMLIRKHMVAPLVKALRLAARITAE